MNAFQKCRDIMNNLICQGFIRQVTRKTLEKEIMKSCGIDPRTINNWIKVLCNYDFLVQRSHDIFDINVKNGLIVEMIKAVKEEPQTKLL